MDKSKLHSIMTGRWLMAGLLSAWLAGCGGGDASPMTNVSGDASPMTTVSGIAATGKPVNGASVQMVCANSSSPGTAVTTGADGAFTVSAPLSPPCVIRVAGGDISGGAPLFSVVSSPTQRLANVNQLTTMLTFQLAGSNPDTGLFQSPQLIARQVTPTAVATYKEMIRANVIENLGAAVSIQTHFDFLEDVFAANNLGFDLMLDKLGFTPGNTPGSSNAILFNGAPILAVNASTGVASSTSSKVVSAATVAAAGLSGTDAPAIQVTTAHMQRWVFINDCGTGTPGTALVSGPASPPLGMGSAQLTVGASNECVMLASPAYTGTLLSHITSMKYASYQSGPTAAITLQFDVRYHPSDTAYQGRLVFEPYQTGKAVNASAWQNWNALEGKWWATKITAVGSNGLCTQNNPCTWPQIQLNWPAASVLGNTLFKAGSGWSSFSGNVDAFTISVDGVDTRYDFD